ncbi:DEAD/DEAH box helicase [Azospirillum sp. TSH100]|uniref:DEAD/DEAH box helicase n=1 Tax=Azospirillum sp. TSH100 TaxID=652764 RepID=UPI000D652525|nr:DEAD/DEAH box helicase [Azospirillum sp. TSH100]QCG89137.1 DEAD/DEAH box helicase [Azospirillum sp. TSH100]
MQTSLNTLISAIAERSAYAVISQSGLNSEPLREHLRHRLVRFPGLGESFLADPVLEAAFGWRPAAATMGDLAGSLLDPRLVQILDGEGMEWPDPDREPYRFRKIWHPHAHQLEAWQRLAEEPPRSVLVASGTGSGKTECFLIPILDDLARQAAEGGGLTGVQALFLYPLNALINSQRDRLTDWTHGFGGRVRFCLYNGETPNEAKEDQQRRRPSEVLSRKRLRQDPPPILVTNITMLEYMLVRTEDAPILNKSRGKLRWIVLDEAHTYIGSQAAELALLLRRVMRAFGVDGSQVRFVATSATLGEGPDVRDRLQRFLADLAGVPKEQVVVITGERAVPDLPEVPDTAIGSPAEIAALSSKAAFERLAASPRMRDLRQRLVDSPLKLSDAVRVLMDGEAELAEDAERRRRALDLVEQGGRAKRDGHAFLPLRLHLFHRAQPGFWACIDPGCPGRAGTPLDTPDWRYGAVFTHETDRCSHCGTPTFEIVGCTDCGAPVVVAEEAEDYSIRQCQSAEDLDEFAQDVDPPTTESDDGDGGDDTPAVALARRLIIDPAHPDARHAWLDRKESRLLGREAPDALPIGLRDDDECPACGCRKDASSAPLFRSARFGAPFLLGNAVPQLLEASPPRGGDAHLPFDGRQLITFTDSRQGTARFAAKLQQDAERNFVRSAIYHAVQAAATGGHEEEIASLEKEMAELEPVLALAPQLRGQYDTKREKIEALKADVPAPAWRDVQQALAGLDDLRESMVDLWHRYDSDFSDPSRLADFQLWREFLRRPKRLNSAETMGLASLRFDTIERIPESSVPGPFVERGLGISDWRDFLYVLITHFVRNRSAVALELKLGHWIGRRVSIKRLKRPGEPTLVKGIEIAWPWATRETHTSAMVRLLSAGLRLDLADPAQRDRINECLQSAYNQILGVRDQQKSDFVLDLRKARITPVEKAWLCPKTGRVLDRTFLGLTPFLPLGSRIEAVWCEPIQMPRLPFPWRRSRDGADVSVDAIKEWLSRDERVQAVRDKGVWTDLHDRIVEGAPYVRSVEHSAQQPSRRLQRYERAFKEGRINILNCSTTMEMGVDIGGLSTVVMTNVPPAPANYRQRVGRAGRRGESLAIGFTFCKDNPLGWAVFREPTWPFRHAIRPPSVSLDSPVIVQRHVNALLLSAFLRDRSTGSDIPKLEAGTFFEPSAAAEAAGRDDALSAAFQGWCENPAGLPRGVANDLKMLVAGTCLEGRAGLRFDTAAAVAEVTDAWRREWRALKDSMAALPSTDDAARKALNVQLKRLQKAYLLSELASRGVLPGYGFPTDIVSFVNTTAGKLAEEEGDGGTRDDNRFTARGYPTRQLSLAIRDYAPGSDVVVDGLVYRSSGVTLNWKRPASDEGAREIQAIGFAWKCRSCGVTDTAPVQPELCSACGSDAIETLSYLQPAGFSVDLREKPHADITQTTYLQPIKPWISARSGQWTALPDPSLGRYRVTRTGHVFHFAPGAEGYGYAVCLHCGRAAAEHARAGQPDAVIPRDLVSHLPLRGAVKGRQHDGVCPGADTTFGIKRHLMLGHGIGTDVLELQLPELGDEVIATSLAVALREALARRLGVEIAELGWASVLSRAEGQVTCYSLFLYDLASGGAGFSSAAGEFMDALLRDAEGVLDCRNPDCRSSCHACLLSRDTQYDEPKLDRRRALEFLQTSVLRRLALPTELAFFGIGASSAEVRPLVEAIDRAMHARPDTTLQLWLGGTPADWDFVSWPARPLLEKWGAKDRPVVLTLAEDTIATLTFGQKISLRSLLERSRADLASTPSLPKVGGGAVLARVHSAAGDEHWAAAGAVACVPDAGWGDGQGEPIVVGRGSASGIGVSRRLDSELLFQTETERADLIRIASEMNGPAEGFGQRFWALVLERKPEIGQLLQPGGKLSEVVYQDRYLFSPLPVRLLCEVLKPIAATGRAGEVDVLVRTRARRSSDYASVPFQLRDDWAFTEHRDDVVKAALARLALRGRIETGQNRDLPHERTLLLRWDNGGELKIHLDQGFGHWDTIRPASFPFTANPEAQSQTLLEMRFDIRNRTMHPMSVFVLDIVLAGATRRPA